MPDLFFYRDPEEVEREEAAKEIRYEMITALARAQDGGLALYTREGAENWCRVTLAV